MAFPLGHRFGAYQITGLLGAGGMGEVYRARDTKLDRDVAIKILPEGSRGGKSVRTSTRSSKRMCRMYAATAQKRLEQRVADERK